MYKLFEDTRLATNRVLVTPAWARVKDGLRLSLKTAIHRRRTVNAQLPSNHVLIRLLGSINVPWREDPTRYVAQVQDIALQLAQSFQMTSAISFGRLQPDSAFYGKGTNECIIAIDDWFDPVHAALNWEDLRPIRVLTHPQTDLWVHVPDGRLRSEETGLSVVEINIPMLALQFKCWQLQELNRSNTPRTVSQFLQSYTLPNMLHSHLDVALFNRAANWLHKSPLPQTRNRHPYHLVNWEKETDECLAFVLNGISDRKLTFDQMLLHIPTVTNTSLLETIKLPQFGYSQQYQWGVLLALLPYIAFCLQFNLFSENPANTERINYIRRNLRGFNQARLFQPAMTRENADRLRSLLSEQIEPYL